MKKYILVTGGELYNKGAQAMTYITVDEMAKRHPECEVVLFSSRDASRSTAEKENIKFKILPFPAGGELCRISFLGKVMVIAKNLLRRRPPLKGISLIKQYKSIFENSILLLDISGYALGSNWSTSAVNGYLRRIEIARKFNIPVFLMPQSFGPFDFPQKEEKRINAAIQKALSYASCIMAREQEGADLLKSKYGISKNVIRTPDLVLQSKGIDLSNIYVLSPNREKQEIKSGSVAIVPNQKNNKFGDKENLYSLYKTIAETLLKNQKNVYFAFHSVEDLTICKELKERYFAEDPRVTVIEKELDCVDFSNIVGRFDFLVASRFHSIVHAYKEHTPAIILGWATKYKELAETFDQEAYCFDVRKSMNVSDVVRVVEKMLKSYESEKEKIKAEMLNVQQQNVFDYLKL